MNYKEFNIAPPIRDNNVVLIEGLVRGDTANIVNVRLMDGTEPFDFTGYTEVFGEILKPDGTHVQACATGDPEIDNNTNPYTIQIVNPSEGRISFTLKGQATILTGTYFGQLVIMGDGESLSTTRFNYHVKETVATDDVSEEVSSTEDYASLQNMIAQNSLISGHEELRIDAETTRNNNETLREERMEEIEARAQTFFNNSDSYLEQAEYYMQKAYEYYLNTREPSAEIMAELAQDLDLASEEYVNEMVNGINHNGGTFDSLNTLIQLRHGSGTNIPDLELGEPAWSVDAKTLYIGGEEGPVPINGTFVASLTEPERHDVLWIDLSAGGSIKYHDGTTWQATASATFS